MCTFKKRHNVSYRLHYDVFFWQFFIIYLEFGLNTPPLTHFKTMALNQGGGGTLLKNMIFYILSPGKLDFTQNPKKLVLTWGDLNRGDI